jgi:hypothetical protein
MVKILKPYSKNHVLSRTVLDGGGGLSIFSRNLVTLLSRTCESHRTHPIFFFLLEHGEPHKMRGCGTSLIAQWLCPITDTHKDDKYSTY